MQVRPRRARWVVVVELEQRALAVANLEEAHHLAGVAAGDRLGFPTLDGGHNPLDDDRRLEVRGRAGLRKRKVSRVADGEHALLSFTSSVCGSVGSQPDGGARPESMTTWAPRCGGTRISRS